LGDCGARETKYMDFFKNYAPVGSQAFKDKWANMIKPSCTQKRQFCDDTCECSQVEEEETLDHPHNNGDDGQDCFQCNVEKANV